jgi:hypothetical protein
MTEQESREAYIAECKAARAAAADSGVTLELRTKARRSSRAALRRLINLAHLKGQSGLERLYRTELKRRG